MLAIEYGQKMRLDKAVVFETLLKPRGLYCELQVVRLDWGTGRDSANTMWKNTIRGNFEVIELLNPGEAMGIWAWGWIVQAAYRILLVIVVMGQILPRVQYGMMGLGQNQ